MGGTQLWISALKNHRLIVGWPGVAWAAGPSFLVVLLVLGWFEAGHFVGAGDVAPLVRTGLASEMGSFWNHQMTGAGATTADTGRIVEVLIIDLVNAVGADNMAAQRLLFAAAMALACFGAAHAASLVLRRRGSIAIAGLLGALNPFVLLQLPNLIFPLAIGVTGLLFGELYGNRVGRRTSVTRLVLASLPLAYLSINPPLVAIVVVATGAPVVAGALLHRSNRRRLARLAPAVPLALLVHAFWIAPAVVVYAQGAEGLDFSAVTDPESWSWVYAQNSLGRVATLTAHWGWHTTEYFPWSEQLDSWPWSWMRWALPVGALAGCVAAGQGQRPVALTLGIMAGTLVVLSQGLHEPFSGLNAQLYRNVPGWWLFRDPVSKFGPLLVLAYATLFGLLVDRLLEQPRVSRTIAAGRAGNIAVLVLATAAIAHPWPLLTGEVVAADRGTLPSSHVAVPLEWEDVARRVAESDREGKVAVLPLNDYYQLTTTWGYHGVDIVNQFFDRPVVQRLPGGYFGEKPAFDGLLEEMESAVLDGDATRVDNLFDSLGVSHLVVRHDIVDSPVDLGELASAASQLDGLETVVQTEVATLLVRPRSTAIRAVAMATSASIGSEPDLVGRSGDLVVPASTRAQAFAWAPGDTQSVDMVLGGQSAATRLAPSTAVDVRFVREDDRLVGHLIDRIVVNGVLVSAAPVIDLPLGGQTVVVEALELGGRTTPFVSGMVESVTEGELIRVLQRQNEAVEGGGELSDCNRVDDRSMSELGFSAEQAADSLTLTASAHSACVAFPLPPGGIHGEVSLRALTIAGSPARACVWHRSEGRCVAHQVAEASTAEFRLSLPQDTPPGDLELFVYADGEDLVPVVSSFNRAAPAGVATTRVTYEQIRFSYLDAVVTTTLDGRSLFPPTPTVDGQVSLQVMAERTDLLSRFDEIGDCHRVDERSLDELGISMNRVGSRMELRASAHTACVNAPVMLVSGNSVLVSFTYSSPTGSVPRVCLWQTGPDQCAPAPSVGRSGTYREVIETDPEATELRLYLYVDGITGGAMVAFENTEVVRAEAPTLIIEAASPAAATTPTLHATKRSPSSYRVEVEGVADDFWLVLPESFSNGWAVSGLPDGWTSEHQLADGYANAWRISGEGAATLDIRHVPADRMRWANLASQLGLMLTIAGGLVGSIRRVRP